jgi:hypothetical protein
MDNVRSHQFGYRDIVQVRAMRSHSANDIALRQDTHNPAICVLNQQGSYFVFGERDRRIGDAILRFHFENLLALALQQFG